jgi:hypothetical protein
MSETHEDQPYTVAIRNNETGEVRMYRTEITWHEHAEFLWTDGNFGCDCNRAIFLTGATQ